MKKQLQTLLNIIYLNYGYDPNDYYTDFSEVGKAVRKFINKNKLKDYMFSWKEVNKGIYTAVMLEINGQEVVMVIKLHHPGCNSGNGYEELILSRQEKVYA